MLPNLPLKPQGFGRPQRRVDHTLMALELARTGGARRSASR